MPIVYVDNEVDLMLESTQVLLGFIFGGLKGLTIVSELKST